MLWNLQGKREVKIQGILISAVDRLGQSSSLRLARFVGKLKLKLEIDLQLAFLLNLRWKDTQIFSDNSQINYFRN
jgi:hypothetical protein